MISLIPCYSLEDFSLYRQSSEVDEIFSAWSALYHPALVAHFGEAPRWEAAGSPSTGKDRKLVVVPPCAEYLVSRTWLKAAEEEGAIIIRHTADRDEILKTAFEKLGVSPFPTSPNDDSNETASPAQDVNAQNVLSQTSREEDKDAVESFLAVGLCCLLEELLTRKLRYMSNLDQVSFKTRIVDAAKAYMAHNVEEREKNLQKAFDLLTTSKEYFFPTATKLLDLTWTQAEDLAEALPNELKIRRSRNENTNLVFPVPLLKQCEKEFPETLKLLQEEVQAQRVVLIGGDEWESPLYLMSPTEIGQTLLNGKNEYLRVFGTAPVVFGRNEAGYAQTLPQLLKQTGYKGVLSRTGDGWSLLEKPSDRSQIRWQGRDGSIIATFCKKALDATSSEDILQLPDRIGNSYYSDDASAIVFEHRPGTESRWLHDLIRMDRYSPVLGKFYDVANYFRVTEGAGEKEKFVKDCFKTNFLTRSSKRERVDLVSLWVRRQRLGQIEPTLERLETTLRTLTLKTKTNERLQRLFENYLNLSNDLKKDASRTLKLLDEYLLPVEQTSKQPPFDIDALFEQYEERKTQTLEAASQYLKLAFEQTEKGENAKKTLGTLFINVASASKEILWEVRSEDCSKTQNLYKEFFAQVEGVTPRVFSCETSEVVQYVVQIPAGGSFWLPKFDDVEYQFIDRPLFDFGQKSISLLAENDAESSLSANAQNAVGDRQTPSAKKLSLFQRVASTLKGEVPNSAKTDPNSPNAASDRALAEYVVKRYSATEIEKYYQLKNDAFEIRIDPVSGTVRRLTTFTGGTRFSNGVLRQPGIGNRLAWDFAFKLPKELLAEDRRSEEDPCYGYTIPAADSIETLASEPGIGRIRTSGRMMTPTGEIAGRFSQTLTIRLKSKLIEVEAEIEPLMTPGNSPWDSYFGCRFAWKDSLAEIRGGVGASLIGTARNFIQAPESVDIRSDDNIGVTILSGGLPYFKKISDSRLDAVLIPKGETKRRFRFAVGIDLADPHTDALAYLAPDPLRIDNVPSPKRIAASLLSSDSFNVRLLSLSPILSESADRKLGSFVGVKATFIETHSANTSVAIRSFLPIEKVESIDLTGAVKKETIELPNANSIELNFAPRQLRTLNIYFKSASLK